SLAAADIEPLRAWAAGAGYERLELALLTRQARPAGLLALFSSAGAPLESADLETLGAGVPRALARLEAAAAPGRDQRIRAPAALARGIAHDFSNVLTAILGHTGALAALVGDRPAAAAALERLRKIALDGAATLGRVQAFSDQPSEHGFDAV